ncbi:MAG: YbhB/YbcL family Raf kinase inhibitor-like protein [Polyangiaceae bacterium]|nr:YbhB/YbcL family Raf kinase inhibitor-like protein [Polyangiaceae bacterium]
MSLTSDSFASKGDIPTAFTCEGEDAPPGLRWTGVPGNAKSLAIIVDDPDAPGGTFTHWVLYDIPTSETGIPERGNLPAGSQQGTNGWDKVSYGGPCPPSGKHRYVFKLYALDTTIGKSGLDRAALEGQMKGHIVAEAQYVGTYEKKRS